MKDKYLFPDIFEASFVLMCLWGIQLFLTQLFYYTLGPFEYGDPFFGGVSELASFGIAISFLMHFKDMTYRDVFHPSKLSPIKVMSKNIIPLIFVIIGVFTFDIKIGEMLSSIFPMSRYFEEAIYRLVGSGIHSVITVSFIAPFVEEILFRGIILKSFLEQYSTRKAIIVSSLLFAIFHMNIYQFVFAFIIGALSGWVYTKTYSLYPCIFIHCLYNSICLTYVGLQKTIDFFPFKKVMSISESLFFLVFGVVFIMLGMFPLSKIKKKT